MEKKIVWNHKQVTSHLFYNDDSHSVLFTIADAVNCCAVMSTNMVAFLLLNNHRKVSTCIFVVVVGSCNVLKM